jgi:hypothetical protein
MVSDFLFLLKYWNSWNSWRISRYEEDPVAHNIMREHGQQHIKSRKTQNAPPTTSALRQEEKYCVGPATLEILDLMLNPNP